MNRSIRLAGVAALAAAALTGGTAAAHASDGGDGHAVFVQANSPTGNAIVAYRRHPDGTLVLQASYATGGRGGRTVGSASDPLASQGSLVYDRSRGLLLAVNAGSDSVSTFGVEGDALHLNQVISSGGAFPVSVAVSRTRNLVYVLNAGSTGSVTGYRLDDGKLDPISGSGRSLGLSNTNPPFFLSSPAQAGFTRDGRHLVVTTKTNNLVDVFAVQPDGSLSTAPTVNALPGVPFAFVFDHADQLVLVSAGTGSVSTFTVNNDGSLTLVGTPVSNGQTAACWIKPARGFEYVANTGSGTISQFRVDGSGTVALVNPVAAAGIPGAIDMAAAEHGRFLYVESGGSGSLDAFGVNANGALALIQSGAVPGGASLEGIIAT